MTFSKGVKDGLPIGVGYFAVSFAFGINAGAALNSWLLATFISMTNVTSAGQFAGLKIMSSATGTLIELAIASFFINLRYSLMAISLSQKVSPSFTTAKRLLLATGITDEIYAVSMAQKEKVNPIYFLGLMTLPYLGWSGGALTGAVCGQILPDMVVNALGVALYGMFVAIVVPPMKSSRPTLIAVLIAIALSFAFFYAPVLKDVSSGFAIIICAVVASLICAALFPVKDSCTAESTQETV
ncbi:AzlC family ABC transporter permease [Fibrobacter sp. UWR1]|uniref:AzlC family ABC transporter permease n=1 Tax=Fibrobacter sp. UWR1 TaxID=2135645 RepID=UPI000DABBBD1|nr:AzlC family ABC transporter permease [Fibrobacter sp. UWR1]PZW69205.1 putative branched-subunit amino acid permease [Fibrobacter sp. UWR1]